MILHTVYGPATVVGLKSTLICCHPLELCIVAYSAAEVEGLGEQVWGFMLNGQEPFETVLQTKIFVGAGMEFELCCAEDELPNLTGSARMILEGE